MFIITDYIFTIQNVKLNEKVNETIGPRKFGQIHNFDSLRTKVIIDSICSAMRSMVSWWVKIFLSLFITFRANVWISNIPSPCSFLFALHLGWSFKVSRSVYIEKHTCQFYYKSFWTMQKLLNISLYSLREKSPNIQIRGFFWSVFSRIWTEYRDLGQSRYRKIWTRKNSVFGYFSQKDWCPD